MNIDNTHCQLDNTENKQDVKINIDADVSIEVKNENPVKEIEPPVVVLGNKTPGFNPQVQGQYTQQQYNPQQYQSRAPPPPRYPQQQAQVSQYQQRGPPPPYNQEYDYDDETLEMMFIGFDSKWIRRQFIQKVLLILAIQFATTFGFLLVCLFVPDLRIFVVRNPLIAYIAIGVQFVLMIALMCYRSIRRKFPLNLILLGLFTGCFAYFTAFITARYKTYIVISSIGMTLGVVVVILLCATLLPCDMTKYYMYFIIGGVVLCIFSMVMMVVGFWYRSNIMFVVYSSVIALFFTMYLWFDIQMVMGGKTIELSPDEYIAGAITIYIDVMQIFIAITSIFAGSRQ